MKIKCAYKIYFKHKFTEIEETFSSWAPEESKVCAFVNAWASPASNTNIHSIELSKNRV